jgi:hypothetical protein
MNNFGLLFEYSNNIRIFILLNKLPILAKISKKKKSKLPRNNRKFCFRVNLHSLAQMGQQITKLDFFGFFSKYFGKIA